MHSCTCKKWVWILTIPWLSKHVIYLQKHLKASLCWGDPIWKKIKIKQNYTQLIIKKNQMHSFFTTREWLWERSLLFTSKLLFQNIINTKPFVILKWLILNVEMSRIFLVWSTFWRYVVFLDSCWGNSFNKWSFRIIQIYYNLELC